eukprot:TRINITY_DN80538_c0_g1_i1.p1 TRINITY_DN80538_c0_g1~~TRINITY_DN80538_c0_g1_i1.p1  ORF type:complete len:464 (-),score=83.11 TRINITY_DN80538_c0_g1_i1:10-1236(-)
MGDQWFCVTRAANVALRAVVGQGTEALKVIVCEYLEHKDSRIRRQAFSLARRYISLADSGFRCRLLKALSDVDADIRLDCMQDVTRAANDADNGFRPAVLGMLSDKSVFVRFAAVAATVRLSGTKDEQAAAAIKKRLQDREMSVRIQAMKGLQALGMLKHPDIYPAVVSRLDDVCRGVAHAAAAFLLGSRWWSSQCYCDICFNDESENGGQACNSVDSMNKDLGNFIEFYDGRYIHQHINDDNIKLVPSVNPHHLQHIDSATLEALRKALSDGSDITRDLIQRGFWEAQHLPDSCRLVAVDMRAVDRSLLHKDWDPTALGHALVQARDLFEVCHASATAGSEDDWEMTPHELREIMNAGMADEEDLEEEELEIDEALDEESGEEEMPDFDSDEIAFDMEDEEGSSDAL